jgi:hypothetical protein
MLVTTSESASRGCLVANGAGSGWAWFGSAGESEVAQVRDSGGGPVDAVSAAATVAQDLVGLHGGEGVFDAGAEALLR